MSATAQQPLPLDMFALVSDAALRAASAGVRVRLWKMSFGEYSRLCGSAPSAAARREIRNGRCYGAPIRIIGRAPWTS